MVTLLNFSNCIERYLEFRRVGVFRVSLSLSCFVDWILLRFLVWGTLKKEGIRISTVSRRRTRPAHLFMNEFHLLEYWRGFFFLRSHFVHICPIYLLYVFIFQVDCYEFRSLWSENAEYRHQLIKYAIYSKVWFKISRWILELFGKIYFKAQSLLRHSWWTIIELMLITVSSFLKTSLNTNSSRFCNIPNEFTK